MKRAIWVAGDFLLDRFMKGRMNGPRFVVESMEERPGGADNTYYNALSICKDVAVAVRPLKGDVRVLSRYIGEDGLILEAWDCPQQDISKTKMNPVRGSLPAINKLVHQVHYHKPEFSTLIVSEYNKGAANVQPDYLNNMPKSPGLVDLLIVDSRYRTVHPDIIKLGKTTIWRCTGSEYDEQYAQQFDWVVHTNHSSSIKISNREDPEMLPGCLIYVPPIEVVDTVGAGDTFTAALSAYLTSAGEISWSTIIPAAEFAVKAAQNVCKKPYTAVTNVTLE